MTLDLCKVFNVVEGEQFKLVAFDDNSNDAIYRIYNNKLEYKFSNEKWLESYRVSINNIDRYEVIKLPRKKEFTKDELCVLKNIDKQYKWIARDSSGNLCIFSEKPDKYEEIWNNVINSDFIEFYCYNHIFKSIRWEDDEPVCIDDYVDRKKER